MINSFRNVKLLIFLIFLGQTMYAQDAKFDVLRLISRTENLTHIYSSEINTVSSTSDEITNNFHPSTLTFDYAIQVGAFAKKSNAFKLQRRLLETGYRVDVYEDHLPGKSLLYLVWIGSNNSIEATYALWQDIKIQYQINGVLRMRSATLHSIKGSSIAVN